MTLQALPPTAAAAVGCAVCQQPIDPSTALYDLAGRMVCAGCNGEREISDAQARGATRMVVAAFGPLLFGAISLVFNTFFCMTFFAVLSTIAWFRISSGPSLRGAKYHASLAVVLAGLAVAAHPIWLTAIRTLLAR